MRKITETIVHAFLNGESKCIANSSTDGQELFLHGNKIAWKGEHNGAACVFITLAGWPTPTTRERLQGVLSLMGHRSPHIKENRPCLNVCQTAHKQFLASHSVARGNLGHIEIQPNDVVAVVHPCTAMGIAAVTIVEK